MASIVKRKSKYAVIYRYNDANGIEHQKWETFAKREDALKRKKQVEYEQETGTFIAPTITTVEELLREYISVYGMGKWAMSTYEARISLMDNYVLPVMGKMKIKDVTPRYINHFYQDLQTTVSKSSKYHPNADKYVSTTRVREIHKLLHSAFNQGVRWELINRNPTEHCILPKKEEKQREVWDSNTLFKALSACEDPILELAINLAFSCSLRMGELLGLTWDCVDISEEQIQENQACIYVTKELQRVSKAALALLGNTDVYFTFPSIFPKNNTSLVLKAPKTKTSVRKIFLPKAVAEMLVERKKQIDGYLEIFGEEYENYNLVMCSPNGRPIEGSYINRLFSQLIRENDLPKVVFHSLRHTSTTYKLKISGGDIKSVQGDTGHAQATMVTERYAHIMDDDRRINAERFQKEFYEKEDDKKRETDSNADDAAAITKLLQESPELLQLLKTLVKK